MDELYAQFVALIRNFHKLAGQTTSRRGGIIFEWPTGNKLWQEQTAQGMVSRYGLVKVGFNGRRLGLRAKKGKAICKPWTFATSMQSVVDAFSAMRCARGHHCLLYTSPSPRD